MATPCIACARSARLAICLDCMTKAEAVLHRPIPWTPFEQTDVHPDILKEGFSECYKNSRYTVLWRSVESEVGDLVHLSIKRNDKLPIHDWRDLQRIKNEVLGPEHEAMELYPAESRIVDTANQYHLWCFLGQRAPFGYDAQRCVMEDTSGMPGARQRPFEEPPKDLLTEEQFQAKLAEHNRLRVAKAGLLGQITGVIAAAHLRPCQRSGFDTDGKRCENVFFNDPAYWCGPCMAKLLQKLGDEVAEIQKQEGGRRG